MLENIFNQKNNYLIKFINEEDIYIAQAKIVEFTPNSVKFKLLNKNKEEEYLSGYLNVMEEE